MEDETFSMLELMRIPDFYHFKTAWLLTTLWFTISVREECCFVASNHNSIFTNRDRVVIDTHIELHSMKLWLIISICIIFL